MAVNEPFELSVELSDAGDRLVVDGSNAETGAVQVFEVSGGGSADIRKEAEDAGASIQNPDGAFIIDDAEIVVSQRTGQSLEIICESPETSYRVVGIEIEN